MDNLPYIYPEKRQELKRCPPLRALVMEELHQLLLENIKRIRTEKGLTQKDVADGADMLVPTYSRLERGQANPSLGSMYRVATALGVGVHELLQPVEIKDRSLAEKLGYINTLSESDRGVIEILIDTVIEKARLEKLQEVKMKKRLEELSKIRDIKS